MEAGATAIIGGVGERGGDLEMLGGVTRHREEEGATADGIGSSECAF